MVLEVCVVKDVGEWRRIVEGHIANVSWRCLVDDMEE